MAGLVVRKVTEGNPKAAYAGVDTRKDTHALALPDSLGRVIGTAPSPTGAAGHREPEEAIGDASVPAGTEGTASYGAGMAARLQSCGYEVPEMTRPKRRQRRRGKSDPIDAMAAARNLAAGEGLPAKSTAGAVGEVRWLMVAKERCVGQRTALPSCIDALVVSAPDALRPKLSATSGADRALGLARSRPTDTRGRALKRIARQWESSRRDADELEKEIGRLVVGRCPALVGARGVTAVSAARLIAAAGASPDRMGGEAAFSMLCGTSPIPASPGRTDRHRLNRGGDRQANRAIHEIANARMSHDGRTRQFVSRKMA